MRRLQPLLILLLAGPAGAQQAPPEIAELRRRIALYRANLPAITATADYAAGILGRDPGAGLLIPKSADPSLLIEFSGRAGGPPGTADADGPGGTGVALLPVRSWQHGLALSLRAAQLNRRGVPVILLGPEAGKPPELTVQGMLDNGASEGAPGDPALNGVANMILGWTFYAELVGAATRRGWQPGIYLSVLVPGWEAHNDSLRFRMPDGVAPPPVPAGRLGATYLAAIDSILVLSSLPAHQADVTRAADSLRARRARGSRLFASSCVHYQVEEIPRDSVANPFRGVDWRWNVPSRLRERGARPGDTMLWFGYAGYDCPNIAVSREFSEAGLGVVLVSNLEVPPPPDLLAYVPLVWRSPDAVVPIPFAPGGVAPVSSVELAVHYLWLRRLTGAP